MIEDRNNWARNFEYTAARLHRPSSVEEIQEIVRGARKVRALGSRHSFNDIADTTGDLISTEKLVGIEGLGDGTVTVQPGIRYGDLARYLNDEGFALHNMASLPHISVAGAVATATHGSGDGNANLASAVSALEVVVADGSLLKLSREKDGDKFNGAVVALGGLGIVVRLTLDIEPAFTMSQCVYERVPFEELEDRLDEITGSAYSVSMFTNWERSTIDQLWLKRKHVDEALPENLFAATLADKPVSPILGAPADNCNDQMGIEGSWQDRLPHFRMDFTPSSGEELQTEYLVPRQHALEAIREIRSLSGLIAPLLHTSEIRTVGEDTLWMSPSYRQPVVGIHFTWHKDWAQVQKLLPQIEERLKPFGARPHWGKLFTMSREQLQPLYERLPDFRELLAEYDPDGKFRNAYLDRYIWSALSS